MPRPLVGLGHSFGGNIITNVALMHPRLFSGLVMIDPVMSRRNRHGPLYGFATMRASAGRRDLWPSRDAAAAAVRRNKFYATWDPRAVDRLLRFGYRDCPTALYPDAATNTTAGGQQQQDVAPVTLTTTKHQECFTYYRPTHLGPRDPTTGRRALVRALIPDATEDVDDYPRFPFYQPPTPVTAARLGELRPPVLWVAGADSSVCPPETRREWLDATGRARGGSGGAPAGRVESCVVDGTGHLVAMERPGEVAARAAAFVRAQVVDVWRAEEDAWRREWVEGVPDAAKAVMSDEFRALIDGVGPEANRRRDGVVAGEKAKL